MTWKDKRKSLASVKVTQEELDAMRRRYAAKRRDGDTFSSWVKRLLLGKRVRNAASKDQDS